MNTETDFPRIRASGICPLCGGDKDHGLIACWPCYRRHDLRSEFAQVRPTIEAAEARLRPVTEITAAGAQYVLPGAEKKQRPGVTQSELLF